MTQQELLARLAALRDTTPGLRLRDAAQALAVPEAALVDAGAAGTVRRLRPDWRALLEGMLAVGRVMCLTRNEHCVHERHGRFEKVDVGEKVGLVLGPDIDLRIFLDHWRHGYAVADRGPSGERLSIQIFDAYGTAVHKIYSTSETDLPAFEALAAGLAAGAPAEAPVFLPEPEAEQPRPDEVIDVAAFRADWAGMRDTHEFFPLLRRHGVRRLQALRLAEPRFVTPVAPDALRRLLEAVAERALPIMVFVGSRGVIQIHSGPVRSLKVMGPWFNVLDPTFNLHLREDRIASAWITRKPTDDGMVTALELFDARGETIAMLFGTRKPGMPEREDWREEVERLAALERAA